MSKFGLLTQIAMILVAVAIGFLYIKPTMTTIRETEDSIKLYQHEVDNVSAVNQDLAGKVRDIDAVPAADSQALLRYMPDVVDDIAVMKDILAILRQNDVLSPNVFAKKTALAAAPVEGELSSQATVTPYDFEVAFKTSYANLLAILSDIEVNDYLLQISTAKITPDAETGTLDVVMTVTAYALAPLVSSVTDVTTE